MDLKSVMKIGLPWRLATLAFVLGLLLIYSNFNHQNKRVRSNMAREAGISINQSLQTINYMLKSGKTFENVLREFNRKQLLGYVHLEKADSLLAFLNRRKKFSQINPPVLAFGTLTVRPLDPDQGQYFLYVTHSNFSALPQDAPPFAIIFNGAQRMKEANNQLYRGFFFSLFYLLAAVLVLWFLAYFDLSKRLYSFLQKWDISPRSISRFPSSKNELHQFISILDKYLKQMNDRTDGLRKINSKLEKELSRQNHSIERLNKILSQEISQRKSIQYEYHTLKMIIEQSPLSILITDADARIEYVNPKFSEITGYSLEEVRGKNPRILKSGEMPPEKYKELWDTITAGFIWQGEFHNKKKNGELYWEHAYISPVKNNDNKIDHYFAIKEDITEQKRINTAREMYASALKKVGEVVTITDLDNRLIYVNDAFEKKFGYKREEVLGADISFLLPEKDRAELPKKILKQSLKQGWNGELIHLSKSGKKINVRLTTSLLKDKKNQPYAIIGISRDITEEKKNIELEKKSETLKTLQELAGAISHEFSQPLQALNNYLSLIELGQSPEKYVKKSRISVEKITDLVNNLRDITSIQRQDYLDTKILNLTASAQNGNFEQNQERRVLIVDDEPAILETLVELLQLAGFKVDGSANGMDALTLLQKNNYQLILSDINMPLMPGSVFFDEAKALGYSGKFIFMTGYAVSEEIKEIVDKGDGVLHKPVDSLQLLEIVQKAVGLPDNSATASAIC